MIHIVPPPWLEDTPGTKALAAALVLLSAERIRVMPVDAALGRLKVATRLIPARRDHVALLLVQQLPRKSAG